ncbi:MULTISPECIES: LPS export ABC transporter permease LptF [unclassified Bartonella]|uniref:LPS export ABC transporter permease LptF n=1 Tax=unclassified Bartonella TaxID=2645622 RepID=UPI0015FA5281|nr:MULTISPECIES: LPS export ABC transporter permease LptF [unclassified Bartonella]UXN04650.1 LPS export ABC transporter permease LptF [Bartonella sp. HY406]UXN07689.1 LPS export ABC transporter permease LptF [Bartonella sp. HY761]
MHLIETYILRRILTLFFAVLLGSIGIVWIVQLLDRINFLTTSGQTFWTFFNLSTLIIPSVIPLVIPFALVIAIVIIFYMMNQDSELVVISAAGSPRYVIWRPVILLAILASISSFAITNYVAPHARLNMRQMLASANSDLINMFLQTGAFRQLKQNIYLEIGERTADGKIGELFIVNRTDPNIEINYYAVSGYVANNKNGDFLVLKNGEIQRREYKTGDIKIIKFESYTFDLSEFAPEERGSFTYPKDQFLSELRHPNPDDPNFQRRPQQYTAELHRRFSSWLYPIVFALIALTTVGDARSHRQGGTSAILVALGCTFFIFWLGYFFGDKADNDLAYIPFLYAVPILSIMFLSFLLLTNRQLSIPQIWQDSLAKVFSKVRFKKTKKAANEGVQK